MPPGRWSPDATMPSRRVRSSSSASRPTRGAVVTGAMQPIMSVATDMEPLVSVVVPTTGSADPRGAGAVFLPAQPATGPTGADGAPVLADPVHAVLDLRVDQHVVHRSSLSSIPGRSRYEEEIRRLR